MNHNTYTIDDLHVIVHVSSFEQGTCEYHWMLEGTDTSLPYELQLAHLQEAYQRVLAEHAAATPLMRRYFLSDIINQQPALDKSLETLPYCATSIIQQPPLSGAKIGMWVYAVTDMSVELACAQHNGYLHYWMGGSAVPERDSNRQMGELFDAYRCELQGMDMTIPEHCVRTWIYVHDVDVNYGGVVEGRRRYFKRLGLTEKTHYISSTGIEGRHASPHILVQMDAYAVRGLQPGQMQYLYAKSHLNPTYEYGVTFERGTTVTYGDRRHLFISGTASINNKGDVMYVGDIERQTYRMLENVEALLAEGEATLSDVVMATVYLRDMADYDRVRAIYEERLPGFPCIFVLAPVCRPTWLIEMECMAIIPTTHPEYPAF